MTNHKPESAPSTRTSGIKRRDVLLRGTSLVAASTLAASGVTTAQAQQPAGRRKPNILLQTLREDPIRQRPASFNLDEVMVKLAPKN